MCHDRQNIRASFYWRTEISVKRFIYIIISYLAMRLLLLVTLILSISLSAIVPVKDLVSKSIRIFKSEVGKVSTWKNSGDSKIQYYVCYRSVRLL